MLSKMENLKLRALTALGGKPARKKYIEKLGETYRDGFLEFPYKDNMMTCPSGAAGKVFWRGDTRPPRDIFASGFKAAKRHNGTWVNTKPTSMVWRGYDELDDVLQPSGVCVAKDIRGAAFLPLEGDDDETWIYGIRAENTVNSYALQQVIDMAERGRYGFTSWEEFNRYQVDWRDNKRFGYNPTYDTDIATSCVWQFEEHVVPEIPADDVLVAIKCTRTIPLQGPLLDGDAANRLWGIRFALSGKIQAHSRAWLKTTTSTTVSPEGQHASSIINAYLASEYPKPNGYYVSYFGIVRAQGQSVHQLSPICVEQGKLSDRGMY
ncbi:MAG: hypothetical protein JKY56_02255 [Kofleriaceae bacterium]|nr:hypothetical protein [Kofleriaceae bacterium]